MKATALPSLLLLSLALATTAAQTGCQATNQAVSSVRGEVKHMLNTSLEQAYKATTKAVDQLKFLVVVPRTDALTAVVTCQTADSKKIEIRLTTEGDRIVGVTIQVGAFGDDRISQAILTKIKENLD